MTYNQPSHFIYGLHQIEMKGSDQGNWAHSLLSQQVFLELRYISLPFQRYDSMVYLRLRKHFRSRVYLKNNSISLFVLKHISVHLAIFHCYYLLWLSAICMERIIENYVFMGIWWYYIASLSLSFYLLLAFFSKCFKMMTTERFTLKN